MLDKEVIARELLSKFAPMCCFHPQEETYPVSYARVLKNSQLVIKTGKKKQPLNDAYKTLLDTHPPEAIIEQWLTENEHQRETLESGRLSLQINAKAQGMKGDYDKDSHTLSSMPIHAGVSEVTLTDENDEVKNYYRLTYLFIYSDNLPPFAFSLGDHLGDIEHITFYVEKNADGSFAETITKAYYSAHGKFEGTWVSGDDIEYDNGHPITYIARGSHADFPHLATGLRFFTTTHHIPRIFLFANDQISDSGVNYQVKPDDILPIPYSIAQNFDIEFGEDVTLGKHYIKGPESIYSSNCKVRQLPKVLKLGRLTLWDPANHQHHQTHEETVLTSP